MTSRPQEKQSTPCTGFLCLRPGNHRHAGMAIAGFSATQSCKSQVARLSRPWVAERATVFS